MCIKVVTVAAARCPPSTVLWMRCGTHVCKRSRAEGGRGSVSPGLPWCQWVLVLFCMALLQQETLPWPKVPYALLHSM